MSFKICCYSNEVDDVELRNTNNLNLHSVKKCLRVCPCTPIYSRRRFNRRIAYIRIQSNSLIASFLMKAERAESDGLSDVLYHSQEILKR